MSTQRDGRDGVVYSSRSEWGYFTRGHSVRVVAPRDPNYGRTGVVAKTYNDAGDMVHRVMFDGIAARSGDYVTEDLVSAKGGGRQ